MICKRIQIRVASQLQSLIPSSSTTYKTQGMHPVSEAKMASSVVLDVHKVQAEGQRFPPPYISVEFQPRNRGREGFKVLALLGLFLFSIAMIVSVYGSSKFSLLPYPEHVEHTADPGLVVTAGSTPTTVPTPPLSSTASPTPTKDPKSFINEKHYTNAVYSEKTPCDDPEFFRIGLVITDVEGSWEGTGEFILFINVLFLI